MKRKTLVAVVAGLVAIAALLFVVRPSRFLPLPFRQDAALETALNGILDDYRKIIVLMDGADSFDEATRARHIAAGRMLFWRKQRALDEMSGALARNGNGVRQLIRYLSSARGLHDADRLAFLDLVEELSSARRGSHNGPLKDLLDNLLSIQLAYREEVTRIFSQFATRGPAATREKWSSYVRDLRSRMDPVKILAEFGDTLPEEPESMRGASNEIFGNDFAPKTVALTFDDGPHPRYTEQVLALLRKYGIRGCFFELGTNLGSVDPSGTVKLARTADISRKVLEAGHLIANHSYSHPVLSKLPPDVRNSEIDRTSLLLEKVAGHKPELFRAPYGARNQDILKQVAADGLRSIMWNIDSLDWADPIPESIAMRVLHELQQKQKGIILFHDIHKQSVMALSPVIEELLRQEYTFLAFDNGKFVTSAKPASTDRAAVETAALPAAPVVATAAAQPADPKPKYYRESWAVIVGINDYQNWPKLRYAVNDANGIEDVLVSKFGFKRENIRKLINGDATRQRIMQVLGDEFSDSHKIQREDRVFFFFAGHGATRTLEDGRQIGFIVPVDASQSNYYSTAISMTALRDAADLIAAKHIYFVMDSCYSGLALSRGIGTFSRDRSYLEEVTRRMARQILTAGGADEQVADDGPNGHSVFTWALLQGLEGQADLDGNGVITASELGAYISPIVSKFARQTPAVGNLVGSEGGEFIFELQPQPLTKLTKQLDPQAMQLTEQLATLQKEIAARQSELLKLQQSIQSETAKLAQVKQTGASAAAVRAKPAAARAYDLDRQGQQLYREKKYDEALQKFHAAVTAKPNDPVLLNNLGFIYFMMGRNDEALTWLEKTLAIDPRRKEAHENIADLYMKLGRRAEAREHYQQFLTLWPTTSRADEVRKLLQSMD